MSTTRTAARPEPGTVRDRYVDFLRALAICLVVLGHWLITALTRVDGTVRAPELLAKVPWTQWLTLGFQIMPLFFLAGGYAALGSWQRHDGSAVLWLRGRALRLLLPTAAYAAAILGAVTICRAVQVDATLLRLIGWALAMQLWFLPVYLFLTAVTPILAAVHRRWGLMVPVVLGAAGIAADIAVIGWHAGPVVIAIGYPLIWGTLYQLGFCWRDGLIGNNRRVLAGMLIGGVAAFAALVRFGPFPISMISVTGETVTNTGPPSVAMLAYAIAQVGLCLLVAPAARRLLDHRYVWKAVQPIAVNSMTVYLWHMVPVVVVGAALYLTGLAPEPAVGSGAWWLLRPAWLTILACGLSGVLWALRPIDAALGSAYQRATAHTDGPYPVAMWIGLLLAAIPLGYWAIQGFGTSDTTAILAPTSFAVGLFAILAAPPKIPTEPLPAHHR